MGIPGASTPKPRPRLGTSHALLTKSFSFSVTKNAGFVPLAGFVQAMGCVDFAFGHVGSLRAGELVGGTSCYRCFIIARLRVVVNEVGVSSGRWRGASTPADSRRVLSRVACGSCGRGEGGALVLGNN